MATLWLANSVNAQAPTRQPIDTHSQTDVEATTARQAIQQELDGNQDAIRQLYAQLDATPKTERVTRSYLQTEISWIDRRARILFETLDELDRRQFEAQRRRDLRRQAERMRREADMLGRDGRLAEAAAREARFRTIDDSFKHGTWKTLPVKDWSSASNVEADPNVLKRDLRALKPETNELPAEATTLRNLLEHLIGAPQADAKR